MAYGKEKKRNMLCGELLLLGIRSFRNMHYSKYLMLEKEWQKNAVALSQLLDELELVNACDLLLEDIEKEFKSLEKEN